MTLRAANNPEDEASPSSEPAPDSGDLRVSHYTAFESGIPPARSRSARATDDSKAAAAQLELVLVESTRSEANLGLLLRGLQQLASGASAAREANAILVQELESLRIRVGKVYERESLLEQRVEMLEAALDAAARERDSWFAQEDEFLAGLLTEHEDELQQLQRDQERRLAELDEKAGELRAQRDISRTEALRLTYERDAAVALLGEPIGEGAAQRPQPIRSEWRVPSNERAPTPTPPPSSVSRQRSLGSAPLAALKLEKPPLKSKPAASSRPLIGYSVGVSDVPEDRLEGATKSSRPPRS